MGTKYFRIDPAEKILLFLEDHKMFSSTAMVAKYLSYLEQSGLLDRVSGLVFGHYDHEESPEITVLLERPLEKHPMPLVRCHDFGHGANNALLPIGAQAVLDASGETLTFPERVTG